MQRSLEKFKGWGIFIVAVFLAILLAIVGAHLVFFDPKLITPVMYFLIAICFFAGAALVLISTAASGWFAAVGLAILSLYTLARGLNVVHLAWLAIVAGIACWLAALILLFVTFPRQERAQQ